MSARLKFILGIIIIILLVFFVRTLSEPSYVVLTFNVVDQSPQEINELLEILEKNEINATFFILGNWAKNNTNLTKLISENYEVASLGMSNTRLIGANLTYEIIGSKLLLENITNQTILGYRALKADINQEAYDLVKEYYDYDSSTLKTYSWFWPPVPETLKSKQVTSVFFLPLNDKFAINDFFYYLARKSNKDITIISFTDTKPLEIDYLINSYDIFISLAEV